MVPFVGFFSTTAARGKSVLLSLCLALFSWAMMATSAAPATVDIHAWGTKHVSVNATAMTHVGSQEFQIPFASAVFPSGNVGVLVTIVAPKLTSDGLYYIPTVRDVSPSGFHLLLACSSLDAVYEGAELEVGWFAFHLQSNPAIEEQATSGGSRLLGSLDSAIEASSMISGNSSFVADFGPDIGTSLASKSKFVTIATGVPKPASKPFGGILATALASDIVETFAITLSSTNGTSGHFGAYATRVDLLAEKHWYQNVGLSWLGWYAGEAPSLENTTFGTATVSVQSCAAIYNLPNGCFCTHKYECSSQNCDDTGHCVPSAISAADGAPVAPSQDLPGYETGPGGSHALQLSATTHSVDISSAKFKEPPMVILTIAETAAASAQPQREQILSVVRTVTSTSFTVDIIALTDEWMQDSYDVEIAYSLHSKKYSCNFSCEMGICIDTKCVCNRGWNGTTCNSCLHGYYGPSCAACPITCGRGYCDDGITGTGKCVCPPGTSGADCSTCAGNFAGPFCEPCPECSAARAICSWSQTANQTFCNCSSAAFDPTTNCTACVSGNFGGDCAWVVTDVIVYATVGGVIAISGLVLLMWCIRTQTRNKYENQSMMYSEPFHNIDSTPGVEAQRQELLRHDKSMFNVMASSTTDWLIDFESIVFHEQIGVGSSAEVFRATYSGNLVAVKQFFHSVFDEDAFTKRWVQEVSTLCRLHHPNVVRFYGATFKPPYYFIITEICPMQLGLFIPTANASATKGLAAKRAIAEINTEYIDTYFFQKFRYDSPRPIDAQRAEVVSPGDTGANGGSAKARGGVSTPMNSSEMTHPSYGSAWGGSGSGGGGGGGGSSKATTYSAATSATEDAEARLHKYRQYLNRYRFIFPPSILFQVVTGICSGMQFIHDKKIVHRDLKPANILLTKGFEPKLCDLASSHLSSSAKASKNAPTATEETRRRRISSLHMNMDTSPLYAPPEALDAGAGSKSPDVATLCKGDVYAFSIILLQLCSVAPVYIGNCRDFESLDDARSFKLLTMISKGERPAIEPHIPAELADVIRSAWATQPSLRPSFHDLLSKFHDRSRDIGLSFVAVENGLRASDDFRAKTTPEKRSP